jgi:hypothetical protein
MASIAHADDRVHLNKFDMYTWTKTYGLPTDGFPKGLEIDGTYVTQMDEKPTEYPSIIDSEDMDHFDPLRLNLSGPMYLKECSVKPAPAREFPARKYEYDNGVVTWDRPGRSLGHPALPRVEGDNWVVVILVIILILLLIRSKALKSLKF